MFIVTAWADGERSGCLIGFPTQTSTDPSRFLVCLSQKNRTYRVAVRAAVLGVHFVPAEADAVGELFGGQTGDEIDKFERCAWRSSWAWRRAPAAASSSAARGGRGPRGRRCSTTARTGSSAQCSSATTP